MSSGSRSPPEHEFNDLSRPNLNKSNARSQSVEGENGGLENEINPSRDAAAAKAKRIACIICRRRKLKCNGEKPSCSTCTRLGHSCAYDEVRKKSGPKRGYVKALEERLKQVETLLKTQDPSEKTHDAPPRAYTVPIMANNASANVTNLIPDVLNPDMTFDQDQVDQAWQIPISSPQMQLDDAGLNNTMNLGLSLDASNFTWELVGLGVDEPLPPQETIDELHEIYFTKVHPSLPMVHKYRYLAAMNLAPSQRPPICLRYAMWTMASSLTDKYNNLRDHFYHRARKYIEQDYLKGHGESMISVSHAQTHLLIATYEFKMMYFPRAWMSTGAGSRMCQMMGLHRLDGHGLDVKQCLPAPRDWTECEERRRTFWMAFCSDRYASIGTGWPMTFDEKDILTNLPAPDEAFEKSKSEPTRTLTEALCPSGASSISSFGGVVLMACLFGRNLYHLHRPDADDKDNDLNGEFWKRHRQMDNILLNTSLSLPEHLRLPTGLSNPNIVFTNMNIHTSTICLHQAAIYKADRNRLPALVSRESKLRCINAANEIARIMRMISHLDLSGMNPFIAFCLYVAARVFVQYLKSRPEDSTTADSLRFLLTAMNVMKAKNPLSESFRVQLDVDLESLGIQNPQYRYFTREETSKSKTKSSLPPNYGLGGDGKIDHCNFLKIIDVKKNQPPKTGDNTATLAFDMQTRTEQNIDSGISGISGTTSSSNDAYAHGFEGDLTYLGGPSGMQAQSNMQAQSASLCSLNTPMTALSGTQFEHLSAGNDQDSYPGMDMDFSSVNPSDNPTPASSSTESRLDHTGQSLSDRGGSCPYATSPGTAVTQAGAGTRNGEAGNVAQSVWSNKDVDYSSVLENAMQPGDAFVMPNTPARGFGSPNGWEESHQGMTPVGEGLFREMMGLGPMEMTWDQT